MRLCYFVLSVWELNWIWQCFCNNTTTHKNKMSVRTELFQESLLMVMVGYNAKDNVAESLFPNVCTCIDVDPTSYLYCKGIVVWENLHYVIKNTWKVKTQPKHIPLISDYISKVTNKSQIYVFILWTRLKTSFQYCIRETEDTTQLFV